MELVYRDLMVAEQAMPQVSLRKVSLRRIAMNHSARRRPLLAATWIAHLGLAANAALPAQAGTPGSDADLDTRARAIHEHVLTLDSHVDVIAPGIPSECGPGQPTCSSGVLSVSAGFWSRAMASRWVVATKSQWA